MTYAQATEGAQRKYLIDVLDQTDGNVVHAAQIAGVNRTAFYRLVHRHGVSLERRHWRKSGRETSGAADGR
jgi:transcriptional regulator of acetoin/glycerol metabolism